MGGYGVYMVRTSHELSTPPAADGMSRDREAEAGAEETVKKLTNIIYAAATNWEVHGTVSAVYGNGGERYLFVGVTGTHKMNDPVGYFNGGVSTEFKDGNNVTYRPSTSKLQDACGDGVGLVTQIYAQRDMPTGSTNSTTTLVAWSTRTTFAIVTQIDITSDPELDRHKDLADTMCDIRDDVES
ncbi:hypothetical protein [Actinomadura meridiana]|uniref:hypothetical protein n=1 Tax=Actinomadura meridiana TaxID=559626 RepID=UPI0031E888D2